MNNILIDIETLGRNPGCVVMSIAAVAFDMEGQSVADLTPLEGEYISASRFTFGATVMSIDIKEQLLYDEATIEPATLHWWQHQSDSAKQALLEGEHFFKMKEALTALSEFIKQFSDADIDSLRVWAQGTDFDIAILRDLYHKHFGPDSEPWLHTNIRDSRTYINTVGALFSGKESPYSAIPAFHGTTHSALCDAYCSAYNVAYLAARLRESVSVKQ